MKKRIFKVRKQPKPTGFKSWFDIVYTLDGGLTTYWYGRFDLKREATSLAKKLNKREEKK